MNTRVKLHYEPANPRYADLHGRDASLHEYDAEKQQWSVIVDDEDSIMKVNLRHIGCAANVISDASGTGPEASKPRASRSHHELRKFMSTAEPSDDPNIREDDEVIVLCSRHYQHFDKRYGERLAVVQKIDGFPTMVAWKRLRVKEGDPFAKGPFSVGLHDPMIVFWEEQLEDGMNDIVAMTTSFLVVQSLRFYIGGVLPDENGAEKSETLFQKNWGQAGRLYACAVVLLILALSHPIFLKYIPLLSKLPKLQEKFRNQALARDGKTHRVWLWIVLEELIHAIRRFEAILINFFFFATSWSLMFATKWLLASFSWNFHSRYIVNVLQAILVTIFAFFAISMVDPMISRMVRKGSEQVDRFEEDMVQLMQSFGFLVGFSWEHLFDEALDAVADSLGESMTGGTEKTKVVLAVKAVISLFCLTLLVPPWQKYMIPMVGDQTYTLGFKAKRIDQVIKRSFKNCGSSKKKIKKMARHLVGVRKHLQTAFEFQMSHRIEPTANDLYYQDEFISRVVSEVNSKMKPPEDTGHPVRPHDEQHPGLQRTLGKLSQFPDSFRGTVHKFKYKFDHALTKVAKKEKTWMDWVLGTSRDSSDEEDLEGDEEEMHHEEDEEDTWIDRMLGLDRILPSDAQAGKTARGIPEREEADDEEQGVLTPLATSFLNLSHGFSQVRVRSSQRKTKAPPQMSIPREKGENGKNGNLVTPTISSRTL